MTNRQNYTKDNKNDSDGSDSHMKRKSILLGIGEDSPKSKENEKSPEDGKTDRKLNLPDQDSKSSFYPQAKGLQLQKSSSDEAVQQEESIVTDTVEGESEGDSDKERQREKLAHRHITEFYPYENNNTVKDIKNLRRGSVERVQTAIQNFRYKTMNDEKEHKFTTPSVQRNALMNIPNKEYQEDKVKSSSDSKSMFGPGYGSNPRVQKISEEAKKKRKKEKDNIELDRTEFYESNITHNEESN